MSNEVLGAGIDGGSRARLVELCRPQSRWRCGSNLALRSCWYASRGPALRVHLVAGHTADSVVARRPLPRGHGHYSRAVLHPAGRGLRARRNLPRLSGRTWVGRGANGPSRVAGLGRRHFAVGCQRHRLGLGGDFLLGCPSPQAPDTRLATRLGRGADDYLLLAGGQNRRRLRATAPLHHRHVADQHPRVRALDRAPVRGRVC